MLFDDPALKALKQSFDSQKERAEGVVRASDRGFGFMETADRDSYFITPQDMKNLLHGDKISAIITEDNQGRRQAQPETLVESALSVFVGRITINSAEGRRRIFVTPDSPTIKNSFVCDDHRKDKSAELHSGDWVRCRLTRHALKDKNFRAEIFEYITSAADPKAPWTVSLRALDLPLECPALPADLKFNDQDLPREDLTALPFITIDSEKTKDMDDAL